VAGCGGKDEKREVAKHDGVHTSSPADIDYGEVTVVVGGGFFVTQRLGAVDRMVTEFDEHGVLLNSAEYRFVAGDGGEPVATIAAARAEVFRTGDGEHLRTGHLAAEGYQPAGGEPAGPSLPLAEHEWIQIGGRQYKGRTDRGAVSIVDGKLRGDSVAELRVGPSPADQLR
jgi:hypothetical protein